MNPTPTLGPTSPLALKEQLRYLVVQMSLYDGKIAPVQSALEDQLDLLQPHQPFRQVLEEMIAERQQRADFLSRLDEMIAETRTTRRTT